LVKVVKYVINDIAYLLCKIFNQSFLIGIFPDKVKHAKITPIFNSTQLNSTGHVTLTAKRDQKKGKKQQLINIPYL